MTLRSEHARQPHGTEGSTVASAIFTVFVGFLLADLSHAQGPPAPLNVTIAASDLARPSITLAITNASGAPITAFAVEITIREGSGSVMTIPRQIDGFYLADERPLLAPGQAHELEVSLPRGASPDDVAITATAVIFDDATVGGLPSLGEAILNRRAARRDEMRHWLGTIKHLMIKNTVSPAVRSMTQTETQVIRADTLASQVESSAKLKAVAELEPLVRASVAHSPVAANLHDNLRRLEGVDLAKREVSFYTLLEMLERQYANAVKHAGRVR
jgi:hypothetical protein